MVCIFRCCLLRFVLTSISRVLTVVSFLGSTNNLFTFLRCSFLAFTSIWYLKCLISLIDLVIATVFLCILRDLYLIVCVSLTIQSLLLCLFLISRFNLSLFSFSIIIFWRWILVYLHLPFYTRIRAVFTLVLKFIIDVAWCILQRMLVVLRPWHLGMRSLLWY